MLIKDQILVCSERKKTNMSGSWFDLMLASSVPKIPHLETFRQFWDESEIPILFIIKKEHYDTPRKVEEFLDQLIKIYTSSFILQRGDIYTSPHMKFWIYDSEIKTQETRSFIITFFVTVFVLKGSEKEQGADFTHPFLSYLPAGLKIVVVVDFDYAETRKDPVTCSNQSELAVIYFSKNWENLFLKKIDRKNNVEAFFNIVLFEETKKHKEFILSSDQ